MRAVKELNTVDNPEHNPAAPPGLRVITKYVHMHQSLATVDMG